MATGGTGGRTGPQDTAAVRRAATLGGPDAGGPPTRAVPVLADPAHRPAGEAAPAPRLGRRYRVLPRTLLGTTAMLVAFAVGAGFSGAVLYSYYQYRLDQNTSRVNALVHGYSKQFADAESQLARATGAAKAQIERSLAPIRQIQAAPGAQAALVRNLSRSLFFVSTEDADGQPSVGTAFVIASQPTESLLLTSYTTVEAATTVPGPQVYVRQGPDGPETPVSVRTWDPAHDLALIVLPRGGLPAVPVAGAGSTPELGQPVYAVSGAGAAGGSIAQGEVDDVSADGVAVDIPIGPAFQGAPIVDASGRVLAVGSRSYAPLGFRSDGVWYSPLVGAACQKVLSCPGGSLAASS